MNLTLVLTTVGTYEDALRIARSVVEERLCACAQLQVIESVFRWKGEVVDEPEYRLLLKTTTAASQALSARLAELHPYELPAVVRIHADAFSAGFSDWVQSQVQPSI